VTVPLTAREVPWDDADAVRLRRGMWEHYRPLFPEDTARAEERFGGFLGVDAHIGRHVVATVLVDDDGAPVGVGSLRPVPRLGPAVGEVTKVFVDPAARGRGVGRCVVVELERIAVRLGWDRLVLETSTGNEAAVALYAGLGFEPTEPLRTQGPVSMAKSLRAPSSDKG